jgi:hypothetical protein
VPWFQFPVGIVMEARKIDGLGVMRLGVAVIRRNIDVGPLACALFLFDVFDAATTITRHLRGDTMVFTVGHDSRSMERMAASEFFSKDRRQDKDRR